MEKNAWKKPEVVLKYWFMLEDELKEAIFKGNNRLISLAQNRIDNFSKVINRDLLEEGLKGDEKVLTRIHHFLHNMDW